MSRSLAVFSPADQSPSHAATLYSLGWVAHRNQRPGEAADYFEQTLRLYEKLDMPMRQATVRTALHSLGIADR
jgi:Tfp pilus assembly protein PilF